MSSDRPSMPDVGLSTAIDDLEVGIAAADAGYGRMLHRSMQQALDWLRYYHAEALRGDR